MTRKTRDTGTSNVKCFLRPRYQSGGFNVRSRVCICNLRCELFAVVQNYAQPYIMHGKSFSFNARPTVTAPPCTVNFSPFSKHGSPGSGYNPCIFRTHVSPTCAYIPSNLPCVYICMFACCVFRLAATITALRCVCLVFWGVGGLEWVGSANAS